MLKFFLVGWVCVGVAGIDQQCVRMGSEVVFPNYEECNEYYQTATHDLRDLKTVEMNFTCVQAGLLEDIL